MLLLIWFITDYMAWFGTLYGILCPSNRQSVNLAIWPWLTFHIDQSVTLWVIRRTLILVLWNEQAWKRLGVYGRCRWLESKLQICMAIYHIILLYISGLLECNMLSPIFVCIGINYSQILKKVNHLPTDHPYKEHCSALTQGCGKSIANALHIAVT